MHVGKLITSNHELGAKVLKISKDPLVPFPILSAKLKITWCCNLRCVMCTIWQKKHHGNYAQLSVSTICSVLDYLKQQGLQKVHFSGGEVLLYPDFQEVITYARKLALQVNFTTNGTLIDKNWARFFINQRVHTITVSIDAAVKKEHDRIRGYPGAWKQTILGIERLLERRNRKGRGPRIAVNTIVSRESITLLPALYQLLKEMSIDTWRLLPLDTLKKEMRPSASQWQTLAQQWNAWQDLLAREPIDWSSQRSAQRAEKGKYAGVFYPQHQCYAPWFNIFIDANGNVYFCCMGKGEMIPFGNIKQHPIKEILDDQLRHDLKYSFVAQQMYPICERCDDFLEENQAFYNFIGKSK